MTTEASAEATEHPESELKRSITGRLLFFYVLGDVLGSGIYVLVGAVAAAVGGAFWIAFAAGVTVATITGLAYAELATKYPQAAGAALYVNKAFRKPMLTFLITICMLSASFAASGSLASGFARYFGQLVPGIPVLLVTIVFVLILTGINFIGITESVVVNMIMTIVEVIGLIMVMVIGIMYMAQGDAELRRAHRVQRRRQSDLRHRRRGCLGVLRHDRFRERRQRRRGDDQPVQDLPAGPDRRHDRRPASSTSRSRSARRWWCRSTTLAEAPAALLEVIRAGVLPVDVGVMVILFGLIAMTAITNTTLVAVVTQSRILYGMARENIFPRMFRTLHPVRRSPWVALIFQAIVVAVLLTLGTLLKLVDEDLDIVSTLANVTVVFLLFIYALVIISALKLRGTGRPPRCLPGQHPTALHRDPGQRGPARLRHRRSTRLGCSGSSGCSPLGFVLYLAEAMSKKKHGAPSACPMPMTPMPSRSSEHARHRRHRRVAPVTDCGPISEVLR